MTAFPGEASSRPDAWAGARFEDDPRLGRLLRQAQASFGLDLRGLTVLTEAATGPYALTATLSAHAGAERVLALARDSRFGSAAQARDATLALAAASGLDKRIEILTDRADARLADAEVVTNLGFVRPLDRPMLRRLKPTAAIALMWAAWEFRPEDLDLPACREFGLPVLATNEGDTRLRTLEYLGLLAAQGLFAVGLEILRSKVVLIGSGPFEAEVERSLSTLGAEVIRVPPAAPAWWRSMERYLADADALVIADHPRGTPILGARPVEAAAHLAECNPGLRVVHLSGNAPRPPLVDAGLRCWPDRFAPPGYMSVTTATLGARPVIELHSAGLAIGAALARRRRSGHDAAAAELSVLRELPFAEALGPAADLRDAPIGPPPDIR